MSLRRRLSSSTPTATPLHLLELRFFQSKNCANPTADSSGGREHLLLDSAVGHHRPLLHPRFGGWCKLGSVSPHKVHFFIFSIFFPKNLGLFFANVRAGWRQTLLLLQLQAKICFQLLRLVVILALWLSMVFHSSITQFSLHQFPCRFTKLAFRPEPDHALLLYD